ncbi:hypothetical protein G6F56_010785 [Rhizopus delemar]|nr:hypothetical protein G6F56_010785 [Rhizopus delemar]
MMGINNNPLEFGVIKEYRGNSHAIGGDTGAVTLANFVKHYNPNLKGAAVLSHSATLCYGPICNAPLNMYRPWLDNNNAAQSGAMSVDLDYELDYLIAHMKTQLGSNYSNVWKLITLQVGSNDQCASCNTLFSKYTTSESYGKNVEAAVERIKKEIPKVVINLRYNKQLDKIAAKYKGKTGDTFAVMYSPPEIDISSFPIEAFR